MRSSTWGHELSLSRSSSRAVSSSIPLRSFLQSAPRPLGQVAHARTRGHTTLLRSTALRASPLSPSPVAQARPRDRRSGVSANPVGTANASRYARSFRLTDRRTRGLRLRPGRGPTASKLPGPPRVRPAGTRGRPRSWRPRSAQMQAERLGQPRPDTRYGPIPSTLPKPSTAGPHRAGPVRTPRPGRCPPGNPSTTGPAPFPRCDDHPPRAARAPAPTRPGRDRTPGSPTRRLAGPPRRRRRSPATPAFDADNRQPAPQGTEPLTASAASSAGPASERGESRTWPVSTVR